MDSEKTFYATNWFFEGCVSENTSFGESPFLSEPITKQV
jgi:hypothetical protein